jgi:hypothetical protein
MCAGWIGSLSPLVTLWVFLGLLPRGVDSLQALERLDFGRGYLFPALDLPRP